MNDRTQTPEGIAATALERERSEAASTVCSALSELSILVALANYGQQNNKHLHRLLAEFRSMRLRLDIHVLSDVPKDLGPNVTVHVGLPTRNPRSLPFAHRRLFAEQINNADYFIYCEDDTLISEKNIIAFMDVAPLLKDDEIPGFLRLEQISPQECYVESAHGPFRWNTSSLVQRGPWTFGSYTNSHSAFTMATQAQISRAIRSGGYLVEPHMGRFGMLECAASDLYTQCGLKRLICLSRIEDFVVSHLSNKNSLKWGLPYGEFLQQTRAFERIELQKNWTGCLLEVETRMSRGRWSKNLYERVDPSVLQRIPGEAANILSIGTGWGATEEELARQGKNVTGIPVDAVFGDCLRRRGIACVEGPIEEAVQKLKPRRFDLILMQDVLHLVVSPQEWIGLVKPLLGPNGVLLATLPRTFDPLRTIWYFRGEPQTAFPRSFAESRVQRVMRSRLKKWFAGAGMEIDVLEACTTPARVLIRRRLRGRLDHSLADRFVVMARPRGAG